MNTKTLPPGIARLLPVMLLPAVPCHIPQVLDCRFAILAAISAAAGALVARMLLNRAQRTASAGLVDHVDLVDAVDRADHPTTLPPHLPTSSSLFLRPWFAIWLGYAISAGLPSPTFQALFGRYAFTPAVGTLWPGGEYMLDAPLFALTDGLVFAMIPAVFFAIFYPAARGAHAAGFPPEPAAACRWSKPRTLPGRIAGFLGPLAVFSVAAWVLSIGIPERTFLADRIDPILSAWNFWWFRKALFDPALSLMHTDFIFQPYGVTFLWHTYEPLNCIIAVAFQSITGADLITTYNFMALASFALIGWAGYLLGRRLGCPTVGFFAGFAMMFCGSHLGQVREGHLDLASAHWLIFFFLFILNAFERGRTLDALAAGLCWSAAFYTHFYHAIFCGMILGIMVLASAGRWLAESGRLAAVGSRIRSAPPRAIAVVLLAIVATMAFQRHWTAWVMIAGVAAVLLFGRSVAATFTPRPWKAAAIAAAVFALAAGPWLLAMFLENESFEGSLDWGRLSSLYSTDLLGYLVPSPVSRGSSFFRFIWSHFLIPAGDSSAFLGFPVIALSGYAIVHWVRARSRASAASLPVDQVDPPHHPITPPPHHPTTPPSLAYWAFMAAAFAVVSLGPKLHIAGATITGRRMPYVAFDAVPFLSASGVAGRYSMPASIAFVMIACIGLARLLAIFEAPGLGASMQNRRRTAIAAFAVIAVIALQWPPRFFYTPPQPDLLKIVRSDPAPGNVVAFCPIDTALWLQTIHGKKMINGFVSRVPPRNRRFVTDTPVLRDIQYGYRLSLSRQDAFAMLRRYGIRWIIVAEKRPRRTIEHDLGLAPVAEQAGVFLYRVE
ncbi:MAG TPA: 6-pyruvoyl-tetrahydropterin synthase-related protein [Phycisphaerae bacterium]|nr:6-pyruvoyl-tetrahydropterin synthase-related protein [Phycisphaerae bacterium]